ncbi:hypothetical protein A605_13230 [Corynebacterium halotolerans YIM 70093 = DSM 44683]|uniref:Uncharacterized protein n=1 Tax=Corynebacterium halotolerans YIM 70093 = DSM 44683 TaxID=1121362 RepID=M1NVZ1_9CORY|nr:hypothetical protein A605_13230 [Corynebacterium halotolerans YIM 70093 = DSM 44683]
MRRGALRLPGRDVLARAAGVRVVRGRYLPCRALVPGQVETGLIRGSPRGARGRHPCGARTRGGVPSRPTLRWPLRLGPAAHRAAEAVDERTAVTAADHVTGVPGIARAAAEALLAGIPGATGTGTGTGIGPGALVAGIPPARAIVASAFIHASQGIAGKRDQRY